MNQAEKTVELLREYLSAMLEKETRRRKDAEAFLDAITDVLVDHSDAIRWAHPRHGSAAYETAKEVSWITSTTDRLYFRIETHFGDSAKEEPGFYLDTSGLLVWGIPTWRMNAKRFWKYFDVILKWLRDIVIPELEKESAARDKILANIATIGKPARQ